MTKLELSLDVSDRLSREASEAGLLAPEALVRLIGSGVRQKATERIRAARSKTNGGERLSLSHLQAIVASVRKHRA